MAPEAGGMDATLDSDELSFLRTLFKRDPGGSSSKRISVAQVAECLEQLDFLFEGSVEDLVRSVAPSAAKDGLTLQDAIRVATSAKAQEKTGTSEMPSLGREDSLAELENSFHKQMMSGEIPDAVHEEEEPPPSPTLERDDSLAQLERSFQKQVRSGDIPAVIEEGQENGPPSPAFAVDVPTRRSSLAVPVPTLSSPPKREMPRRGSSLGSSSGSATLVDVPQRRASVTRPGAGLVGLQVDPGSAPDEESPRRSTRPDLKKQTSEEALLLAAVTLGVDPVQESSVPKRRSSSALPRGWSEAAAEEIEMALGLKRLQEEAEAEEAREREESEHIKSEVGACLSWLTEEVTRQVAIAEAREEAEQKAAEAAAELARVEAARVKAETDAVLRSVVDAVERDAAIAQAKEQAEQRAAQAAELAAAGAAARVSEEAAAREAAEEKAAAAAKQAEDAMRLAARAEEESREREEALRAAAEKAEELAAAERALFSKTEEEARLAAETESKRREEEAEEIAAAKAALEEETRVLKSRLQEAGEEAAERAQEDAEAKAAQDALEQRHEQERASREEQLIREAAESAEREAEAREAALQEAECWKQKFETAQREKEEEAKLTAERAEEEQARAVAEAVKDAREFEKQRMLDLHADEEEHPLDGANVSFESIDTREGKPWWQCMVCVPDGDDGRAEVDDRRNNHEDDYAAAVESIKPEMWIKSNGKSASVRSATQTRPKSGDVCSVM